jgi:predicted enzyme related to lactoylglutathione lyase
MATETLRGSFVWHELMTSDTAGARAFYSAVIGWGVTDYEGLENPYAMWTAAGIPVGGLMELPPDARAAGAPPNWMLYVGAEDTAATYQQALALGATSLLPPQEIPTVGTIAVLADPQGAVFALHTPLAGMEGPAAPPEAGSFSWHELASTDQAAAFDFYRTLFAWDTIAQNDMGPMGIYRTFGRGTEEWGGMYTKGPEASVPPHWLLYVRVRDIEATVAAVKANGGQVLNGPVQVPGGHWVAHCADPQGAVFALHQA